MKRLSLSAAVCLLLVAGVCAAETPDTSVVGAAMTEAAKNMVASLDDAQRAKTVLAFDNPARLDWHNIPKPERKGLQVRDMKRGGNWRPERAEKLGIDVQDESRFVPVIKDPRDLHLIVAGGWGPLSAVCHGWGGGSRAVHGTDRCPGTARLPPER